MLKSGSEGGRPLRRKVIRSAERTHQVDFCLGICREIKSAASRRWATNVFYVRDTNANAGRPKPVESMTRVSLSPPEKPAEDSVAHGRINGFNIGIL